MGLIFPSRVSFVNLKRLSLNLTGKYLISVEGMCCVVSDL